MKRIDEIKLNQELSSLGVTFYNHEEAITTLDYKKQKYDTQIKEVLFDFNNKISSEIFNKNLNIYEYLVCLLNQYVNVYYFVDQKRSETERLWTENGEYHSPGWHSEAKLSYHMGFHSYGTKYLQVLLSMACRKSVETNYVGENNKLFITEIINKINENTFNDDIFERLVKNSVSQNLFSNTDNHNKNFLDYYLDLKIKNKEKINFLKDKFDLLTPNDLIKTIDNELLINLYLNSDTKYTNVKDKILKLNFINLINERKFDIQTISQIKNTDIQKEIATILIYQIKEELSKNKILSFISQQETEKKPFINYEEQSLFLLQNFSSIIDSNTTDIFYNLLSDGNKKQLLINGKNLNKLLKEKITQDINIKDLNLFQKIKHFNKFLKLTKTQIVEKNNFSDLKDIANILDKLNLTNNLNSYYEYLKETKTTLNIDFLKYKENFISLKNLLNMPAIDDDKIKEINQNILNLKQSLEKDIALECENYYDKKINNSKILEKSLKHI